MKARHSANSPSTFIFHMQTVSPDCRSVQYWSTLNSFQRGHRSPNKSGSSIKPDQFYLTTVCWRQLLATEACIEASSARNWFRCKHSNIPVNEILGFFWKLIQNKLGKTQSSPFWVHIIKTLALSFEPFVTHTHILEQISSNPFSDWMQND